MIWLFKTSWSGHDTWLFKASRSLAGSDYDFSNVKTFDVIRILLFKTSRSLAWFGFDISKTSRSLAGSGFYFSKRSDLWPELDLTFQKCLYLCTVIYSLSVFVSKVLRFSAKLNSFHKYCCRIRWAHCTGIKKTLDTACPLNFVKGHYHIIARSSLYTLFSY